MKTDLLFLETFSDQGPYLQTNEDLVSYDLANNIFLALDGFGGVGCGDNYVKEIAQTVTSFYGKIVADSDTTMPFFFDGQLRAETNSLVNAVITSHKSALLKNNEIPINKRGGASGIFMVRDKGMASFVLVGNCSAILIRNSSAFPIFIEDNLNLYSFSLNNNSSSIPMNAIGMFSDLKFQTREVRIQEGDLFLLGTDGVLSFIKGKELESELSNSDNKVSKAKKLAKIANNRGNVDNQSVVVLQF